MRVSVVAASLMSAGLATLITAKVVERKMLDEMDKQVQRELLESVEYLEETGQAEPTEEFAEKRVASTFDLTKPSLDEVVNKNQRIRYDKVVTKEEYLPSEVATLKNSQGEELPVENHEPEIYSIPTDEFMDNDNGWVQTSITYFADGGVLDERGELVVDHVDMIGDGEPPFGENSGEPHVVYLRNTRLRQEFEVVRDLANAADILADPAG